MYPTPPHPRTKIHRDQRESNGQVPVVHSGTQEFYIGDEGEEEATFFFAIVFFFCRHVFFWIVPRNEKQMS